MTANYFFLDSMKNKIKNLTAKSFFIFSLFCLLALPLDSSADDFLDSLGIAVDQSVFSIDAAPGEAGNFMLNISNASPKGEQEKINLRMEEAAYDDNNQIILAPEKNENQKIGNWVKISENDFALNGGETKEVILSLSIPSDALAGSYVGILMIGSLPDPVRGTAIKGKIGVHIMVNVKGDISGKGRIASFETPFIAEKNPRFRTEFENQGNIHYVPHGEIRIANLFGKNLETLNVEKHFVFPGKKFTFESTWEKDPRWGIYQTEASFVDGDGKTWILKRYFLGKLFFVFPLVIIIFASVMIFAFKTIRKHRMEGDAPRS